MYIEKKEGNLISFLHTDMWVVKTEEKSMRPRLRIPKIFSVRHASSKKKATYKDPRSEMIYKVLFENKAPPSLQLSPDELIRHDTIHRAWQLLQLKGREQRQVELEKQYNKMREACNELEKADKRLFQAAMTKPKTLRYPVEMRVPTDTPPAKSWSESFAKQR